jgi:hypothetical protein
MVIGELAEDVVATDFAACVRGDKASGFDPEDLHAAALTTRYLCAIKPKTLIERLMRWTILQNPEKDRLS